MLQILVPMVEHDMISSGIFNKFPSLVGLNMLVGADVDKAFFLLTRRGSPESFVKLYQAFILGC
jgi:hypothetical protein